MKISEEAKLFGEVMFKYIMDRDRRLSELNENISKRHHLKATKPLKGASLSIDLSYDSECGDSIG